MASPVLHLLERIKAMRALPRATPGAFDEIYRNAILIEEQCADRTAANLAREIQFKADHLYCRPHLQPEAVLGELLDDRIRLLEAVVRARA
jgi:hypothetical protein